MALPETGRAYVALIAAAGTGVVLHSLYELAARPVGLRWFILAGLTLLSGSFTVRIPTIPARLSVSETFVFAAAILFGPEAATVIVVLDSLIISLWLRRSSRNVPRVLFNMAAPAISIWVATHTFFSLAGITPLYIQSQPILTLVAPLAILALVYFLLNSWLIAGAVGFEKRIPPFKVWRENFLWLSLNYFSGASVAALLLPYIQQDNDALLRIGIILLPPLLISYLTFKTALGRVDDANRHLTELNRLYLSTIETLAMAIDAKDQITHGHIRRVQQYAIGLARRMGLSDERQIRAIEAASLLHDMGKLAVPEYILNKPGKLTPAEFERMKLHSSVGADILSAIDFPYPVVPIVRHHHENWDGTGYPDGLKGSDIPIGARILSVVDCFDALTSDRPYRPRLSDTEAIKILMDRRSTMYDPLVVDTFIRVYSDLAPPPEQDRPQTREFVATARDFRAQDSDAVGAGLDGIAAGTEEMVVLFELARNLTWQKSLSDIASLIAKYLRRVIPTSTCVLYIYDSVADELVAAHAVGEHADHFMGIRIPRGQRLTGWVAANRQSILNSDPVLDLGEVARAFKPRLVTCLSSPILNKDQLIGVLSLYSARRDGFSEDHQRIVEVVSRQAALVLKTDQLTKVHQASQRDSAQPSSQDAFAKDAPADQYPQPITDALSIALIRLSPIRGHIAEDTAERILVHMSSRIRPLLRTADVLFRLSKHELVLLLAQTNSEIAWHVATRIASKLIERYQFESTAELAKTTISLGVATAPIDGIDVDSLISAARRRAKPFDDICSEQTSIH